jgi:hypothetical protein
VDFSFEENRGRFTVDPDSRVKDLAATTPELSSLVGLASPFETSTGSRREVMKGGSTTAVIAVA